LGGSGAKKPQMVEKQVSKSEPTIEGKKLSDWVNRFLKKQGI